MKRIKVKNIKKIQIIKYKGKKINRIYEYLIKLLNDLSEMEEMIDEKN